MEQGSVFQQANYQRECVARDLSENFSSLPAFDPTVYETIFGGPQIPNSARMFVRCAERSLEAFSGRLAALRSALEAGRVEEIRHAAHQLKGSCKTLGGTAAAAVFELMEHKSGAYDPETLKSALELAERSCQDFFEKLQRFCGTLQSAH